MQEAVRPASTSPLVTLAAHTSCLHFLPSWAPSLAASLLPVVYFLFCCPAEEVGGEYPWPNSRISFVSSVRREGKGGLRGKSTEIYSRPTLEQLEPDIGLPPRWDDLGSAGNLIPNVPFHSAVSPEVLVLGIKPGAGWGVGKMSKRWHLLSGNF